MERKLATDMEIKLDAVKGTFEGYASAFGLVDTYKDTVIPGAYADTLKSGRPISMYFNHIYRRVDMPSRIGRWLKAEEDSTGLFMAGALTPNHPTAEAVKAAILDGTLTGLSIGYRVPEGGSKKRADGVRELHKIDLIEVSPVDDPADAAAQIDRSSIKSMLEELQSKQDIENFLRDVGQFSKGAALAFMSQFQSVILRDADEDGAKTERLLECVQKFTSQAQNLINIGVTDHGTR